MIYARTRTRTCENIRICENIDEATLITKINACHTLKDSIEEEKIAKEESEEQVTEWVSGIEQKLKAADEKVLELRGIKDDIVRKTHAIEKAEVVKEGLMVQQEKHEQKLRQEHELFEQQLKFQKALEASRQSQAKAVSTKLPKLSITKFDGKYENWLPFWNKFMAEIDSTDLSPVTKFAYLKELVESKIRVGIDGLPLTTEGYRRAKGILESEYGKISEIVNAYVQNILELPVIKNANPNEVDKFYKTLLYNVQSLETLGKLERVNGMTRSVLDKLPGIKSDLVRGKDGWQDWGLAQLVTALKLWRDINPCNEESSTDRKHRNSSEKILNTGAKKHGCVYCDDVSHKSRECTHVVDVNERRKILATKRLCFNCTGARHRASECKSTSGCQRCKQRHHTSICMMKEKLLATEQGSKPVVYPIVNVNVGGIECRALLDTGAGSSYASAALLDRLPKRSQSKEVRKIEMMLGSSTREVCLSKVNVESVDGKEKLEVEVTRVERGKLFTVDNPHYPDIIKSFKHLEGVTIVDNDPKPFLPVHLILGASDYVAIKTAEPARVGELGEPVAEKTKFEWTLMSPGKELDHSKMLLTKTSYTDYEELCRLNVLGLEDRAEHDQETVHVEFREQLVRDPNGWYETGLLWKKSHPPLPSNRQGSLRRLDRLYTRLNKMGVTRKYNKVIEQQKEEGIVELACAPPVSKFYLPHKPVVHVGAESTKLRVVYDGSAKENPQFPSLNDCLYAGPSLQNKLWNVLTRMRFHPVALSGDLKQAFLQIRIKKEERDSLRFHWKTTEHSLPEVLRFTRALFGLTCSPFLLAAVVDHHLQSWEVKEPEKVAEIRRSLYVDDLISGKPTVASAVELKKSAIKIFDDATSTLHKWHSNEPSLEDDQLKPECEQSEVKSDSDGNQVEPQAQQTFAKTQLSKFNQSQTSLLGLSWDKQADEISVVIPKMATSVTKRELLRNLARIYDPLGLVSPVTVKGKHIYREACKQKVPWDVKIPLSTEYLQWAKGLPEKVTVPILVTVHRESLDEIQLHAFGDASKKGVAAAVYAITKQASGVNVGLVAAKSRLAKQDLTIPRLELVSAHMATNLVSNVKKTIDDIPVISVFGWLDSTVVLQWLRGPGEYKQFVANRVKKIHEHPEIHATYPPMIILQIWEAEEAKFLVIKFGGKAQSGWWIPSNGLQTSLRLLRPKVSVKQKQ